MLFNIQRDSIQIRPEHQMDIAYLLDTLGLDRGNATALNRVPDDSELGFYLEITKRPDLKGE